MSRNPCLKLPRHPRLYGSTGNSSRRTIGNVKALIRSKAYKPNLHSVGTKSLTSSNKTLCKYAAMKPVSTESFYPKLKMLLSGCRFSTDCPAGDCSYNSYPRDKLGGSKLRQTMFTNRNERPANLGSPSRCISIQQCLQEIFKISSSKLSHRNEPLEKGWRRFFRNIHIRSNNDQMNLESRSVSSSSRCHHANDPVGSKIQFKEVDYKDVLDRAKYSSKIHTDKEGTTESGKTTKICAVPVKALKSKNENVSKSQNPARTENVLYLKQLKATKEEKYESEPEIIQTSASQKTIERLSKNDEKVLIQSRIAASLYSEKETADEDSPKIVIEQPTEFPSSLEGIYQIVPRVRQGKNHPKLNEKIIIKKLDSPAMQESRRKIPEEIVKVVTDTDDVPLLRIVNERNVDKGVKYYIEAPKESQKASNDAFTTPLNTTESEAKAAETGKILLQLYGRVLNDRFQPVGVTSKNISDPNLVSAINIIGTSPNIPTPYSLPQSNFYSTSQPNSSPPNQSSVLYSTPPKGPSPSLYTPPQPSPPPELNQAASYYSVPRKSSSPSVYTPPQRQSTPPVTPTAPSNYYPSPLTGNSSPPPYNIIPPRPSRTTPFYSQPRQNPAEYPAPNLNPSYYSASQSFTNIPQVPDNNSYYSQYPPSSPAPRYNYQSGPIDQAVPVYHYHRYPSTTSYSSPSLYPSPNPYSPPTPYSSPTPYPSAYSSPTPYPQSAPSYPPPSQAPTTPTPNRSAFSPATRSVLPDPANYVSPAVEQIKSKMNAAVQSFKKISFAKKKSLLNARNKVENWKISEEKKVLERQYDYEDDDDDDAEDNKKK